MKKLSRLFVTLFVLVLSVSVFTACSGGNLDDYKQTLTNYKIDAVYSQSENTLTVSQTVDYYNSYEVELYDIYFHLYPAAYREGARFSPITAGEFADAYPAGTSYGSIEFTSVKVGGKAVEPSIMGQDEDILVVTLENHLMPTARVSIEMEYTVRIPNVRHRLGYVGTTVNLGNFYPIACVYENGEYAANPYYSNGDPFYSQIANYEVSITAPSTLTAVMSGKSERSEVEDNAVTTSKATAMRDFAVVLGEFVSLKQAVDGIDVYYYFTADGEPDLSLKAACDSISTFNTMFGKYPYESYSVVQTHFLNSGMEYPGLTYISNAVSGGIYRDTIIHETAHQWWYAVVGNNQVKHAWLDETLAEYSATMFYQNNPGYNVGYTERIADALKGYSLFCELTGDSVDTSMTRALPEFNTPGEYVFMTYTKGQIMMDSLRRTIGEEAFTKALKNYYSDNFLKIAKPEHLISQFENACSRDLEGFFSTWLDGNVLTFSKA